MIVCIAEKPSVARDIANILGATVRRTDKGIGHYEGNGYAVTWTFGHLCTLKEPHDYTPGVEGVEPGVPAYDPRALRHQGHTHRAL